MQMKVWWIPQVPMKSFEVSVTSVAEAVKIMDVLANYDLFQYENNIKPDYCNGGGLLMFDENDPEGSWYDWYDEETGIDDPKEYLEAMNNKEV